MSGSMTANAGHVPAFRRRQHNEQATSTSLRFWSRSMGDRNPLFVDPAVLPVSGGGMRAHPCWLYSVHDTVAPFGHPDKYPILAGAAWRFFRPVIVGDRICVDIRLLDEKPYNGRLAGESVMQQVEVEYLTPHREPIASVVSTLALVSPDAARASEKYAGWSRWKYTPEQLTEIEDGYDAETVRGGEPLYWEDVAVGDDIPSIVRGPVTSEEMTLFVGATRPVPSLTEFAEIVSGDYTASGFPHSVSATYETYATGMVDDITARALGFPAAHDYGIDRISQLCSMLTNWIGDGGEVKALDTRLSAPLMLGEAAWFSGKVMSVEAGPGKKGRIFAELTCVNQGGVDVMAGSAEIELPRRAAKG